MARKRASAGEIGKSTERVNDLLIKKFYGNEQLMAYCADVSCTTVTGYLKGKYQVGYNAAHNLSEVVDGLSAEWLMGKTDDPTVRDVPMRKRDESMLTTYGKHEARRYRALHELIEAERWYYETDLTEEDDDA